MELGGSSALISRSFLSSLSHEKKGNSCNDTCPGIVIHIENEQPEDNAFLRAWVFCSFCLVPTSIQVYRGGGLSREKKRQALDHEGVLGSPVARYTPVSSQPGSLPGVLPIHDGEKANLEEGFPLRCFQRFSRPNVATRLCLFNNRHTRGWSTPVLSY